MKSYPYPDGFRIDQLSAPQAMRIVDIQAENPYTKTFILDGILTAQPGQFVMVWLPDQEERPFSLVNDNPITLTVAAVGAFTQAIHQQKIGDRLWLRGPFGQSYHLPGDSTEHLLLIGESYFVGSLLFLARQAKAAGHSMSVILLVHTPADLTLVKQFETLATSVQVIGDVLALEKALAEPVPPAGANPIKVFGSGSAETLHTIAEWGNLNHISTQLAWKAPMKCGVGVCGSCELAAGWLVCVDGPVLSFNPNLKKQN